VLLGGIPSTSQAPPQTRAAVPVATETKRLAHVSSLNLNASAFVFLDDAGTCSTNAFPEARGFDAVQACCFGQNAVTMLLKALFLHISITNTYKRPACTRFCFHRTVRGGWRCMSDLQLAL
jgi:hypothetical protein